MLRYGISLLCFVTAFFLFTAFLPAECWVGHDRPFNSTEKRDTSVPESRGDKTLTLTILDEADRPIPGARFSYFGSPEPHPAKTHRHYVQADENGRFTIRLKSNVVQNLLEIQVDHPGYAPYNAQWEKPQTDPIPGEYTIKLEKAETVGGIVLDDAGKPGSDNSRRTRYKTNSKTRRSP